MKRFLNGSIGLVLLLVACGGGGDTTYTDNSSPADLHLTDNGGTDSGCTPDCTGKECGDNGCGGSCGTCGNDEECKAGKCSPSPCWPHCGEMVAVPEGPFMMGCNETIDTECDTDEHPYHEVNVPGFEIDKTEVTVAQYKSCVDAAVCSSPQTDGKCNWDKAGKEQRPVNCLDWTPSDTYCKWAGKRLCSEAEWEKAARGTDGRKYPWGNETPTCDYAVMTPAAAGGCDSSSTADVGSKPAGASPYGALDMSGNVWEWVQDTYHVDYTGAPTDGTAWVSPEIVDKVRRGGFYDSGSGDLRVSARKSKEPSDLHSNQGFRCCRSL